MPSFRGSLIVASLFAFCASALAADPVDLGTFKDWTAHTSTSAQGKTCYAVTAPVAKLPKGAKRDEVYIVISTWPGRGVIDELQIAPGYLYRDGEPVWAQVGNSRTEFFTRNDGKTGSAWIKDVAAEASFVGSLRGGSVLIVTGISKRGTKTTDTYSLSGIAAALDRAHRACGN